MRSKSETVGNRRTQTEMWDLWTLVRPIWMTFDLVVFMLGLFREFVSKIASETVNIRREKWR